MSGLQTRQQGDMKRAINHIQDVKAQSGVDEKAYGRLCHSLPILVHTNGLCQTLAFLKDKGSSGANSPQSVLLNHISEVLGTGNADLLSTVQDAPLMEYIRYSRRISEAWVYYKRFSVSILGVEQSNEDGGD